MFFFCLVFAMSLSASVYMCFVVTCWERAASWLWFVVSNCEFVTFPLVSWVRCGTSLYRFLIFAPLLIFVRICNYNAKSLIWCMLLLVTLWGPPSRKLAHFLLLCCSTYIGVVCIQHNFSLHKALQFAVGWVKH